MAGRSRASYTAFGERRQSSRPQGRSAMIAALASGLMLAGCATIRPLSAWVSGPDTPPEGEIVTGSIPKPTVVQPPPESDGEVIRRTVEAAVAAPAAPQLAWSNPSSGHSGTITGLVPAKAKNGAPCRDFATTFASIEGVSMYRGRACQGYSGPWDLIDFAPAETPAAG